MPSAVCALALLCAAPAHAGEARFHVGGQSVDDARVTFELDEAVWRQMRGEMAGTPMIGSYHAELGGRPENEHCTISLDVFVRGVRRGERPRERRGVLRIEPARSWGGITRFRVAARERRGATRTYRSRAGREVTGVLVRPTPRWAGRTRPVTVARVAFTSSLHVLEADPAGGWRQGEPTAEQRAACDAFIERHAVPTVRRVLRTLAIERT